MIDTRIDTTKNKLRYDVMAVPCPGREPMYFRLELSNVPSLAMNYSYLLVDTKKLADRMQHDHPPLWEYAQQKLRQTKGGADGFYANASFDCPASMGTFALVHESVTNANRLNSAPEVDEQAGDLYGGIVQQFSEMSDLLTPQTQKPRNLTMHTGNVAMLAVALELNLPYVPIAVAHDDDPQRIETLKQEIGYTVGLDIQMVIVPPEEMSNALRLEN